MFIWPNGSVTGSVLVAELDAFRQALAAGEPLDAWARFIPDGFAADDYKAEAFPLPDPEPDPAPDPAPEPAPAPAAPAKATSRKAPAKE